MEMMRASGIILHPTSLPSPSGIGNLGKEAYEFVDFLQRSGQKFWQILPLGPVGYAESPYQPLSAFAGNTMLISPEKLKENGLLKEGDLASIPPFPVEKVQFDLVKAWKEDLLKKAFQNFCLLEKTSSYLSFLQKNRLWLENYVLFIALKEYFGGLPWNQWEKKVAFREETALQHYREILREQIEYHNFVQFIFFSQWQQLRNYANERGIKIIGDLPIFVSYDSSDAWANPQLFELDKEGNPTKVAGVPPDYFSETGQLWGNPHYKWEEMEKDQYKWWRERFSNLLDLVDVIRVDHFRGFESYWEIPGGEETAINGQWIKAPGEQLFAMIKKYLGELPIIAEDLGIITPEVEELKNMFNFPGMKVLHFSLGSRWDRRNFLCNMTENTVVYTGTHDNDTSLGWYRQMQKEAPQIIKFLQKYLGLYPETSPQEIGWKLVEIVWQSRAKIAIVPLQDVLGLGTEARMNLPGTTEGNWQWRFAPGSLTRELEERLAWLTKKHQR